MKVAGSCENEKGVPPRKAADVEESREPSSAASRGQAWERGGHLQRNGFLKGTSCGEVICSRL